ncbi:hypothetical protein SNE40_003645 [Patella caerulea]|uniref:Cyclin-D-binding Myb-like transcription factor 1 n=1 Tax=Patella caerulea TaxID=87958 RepID=A0AAN8Q8U2_PATCE
MEVELQEDLPKIKTEDSDGSATLFIESIHSVEGRQESNEENRELNETTDTETFKLSSDSNQQYVIVSSDSSTVLQDHKIINAVSVAEDGSEGTIEQPTKFIRIQGDNGQTLMLAVADDSSNLLSQVKILKSDGSELKQGKAGKSSSADDITQAWFTTRDDKNSLHNKGHTWKQGQWTKEEVDILKKNIEKYCKDRNIPDATKIIFQMSKDERKDFYRTVARGLERPLFSVYRRVTRMYDQKNHVGKYTPEEMVKLRDLRAAHGNDWTTIGTALGRSASSVKDKCRLMKDKCNSGKWLAEEEKRLTAAVYELAQVKPGDSITVTHGLSWALVAEKVASRSEKQCRTKWLNYLNWKELGGTEWTREDDLNLILRMCELNVENESQINWPELAQGWPSARSPQWLRGKWWSLKRHVHDYQNQPFSYIVNYLKTSHLQHIKNIKDMVGRDDLTVENCEVTFSVPISLQSATSADDVHTAIEVLQQWPSDCSGALVIAQPNTTSGSITFSGSALPSDHIIVQTLPVHVEDNNNENVTVQVNPQIIVTDSTDEESMGGGLSNTIISSSSIELHTGLKVEQDLNSLSENRDLDDQCEITSNSEVKYEIMTQTVTDSGLPSEGVQTDIHVQSDMVHSEGETSNLDW